MVLLQAAGSHLTIGRNTKSANENACSKEVLVTPATQETNKDSFSWIITFL